MLRSEKNKATLSILGRLKAKGIPQVLRGEEGELEGSGTDDGELLEFREDGINSMFPTPEQVAPPQSPRRRRRYPLK